LTERFGLGNASIRSLRFETEAPVDDILIETDGAGWIFTQAKSSLTLSATSDSELGSVADQIVRQWHACAQGPGERGWDRPLDPTRDRILIAVGRKTPATVSEHLASALTAIQANSTAPLPMRQRMALDTFTARLRDAWQALVGAPPDATATQSMLRLLRIERLVEIRGVLHFGSYSWLSRPLPASGAGAGGSKRAVGRAELFAPITRPYFLAPPTHEKPALSGTEPPTVWRFERRG
jgi:hypothetical protein